MLEALNDGIGAGVEPALRTIGLEAAEEGIGSGDGIRM